MKVASTPTLFTNVAFEILSGSHNPLYISDLRSRLTVRGIHMDEDVMVELLRGDDRFNVEKRDTRDELLVSLATPEPKPTSKTIAISAIEAVTDDKGLPARRADLEDVWEVCAGFSDYVLVRAKHWTGLHVGRYCHNLNKWKINNIPDVDNEVIEWWPLPKEGTGVKVEV